jgi:methionyl-tRNA synthetase
MDTISFEEFKKMDLRIALVKKVQMHPNADKLYVMTIDVGGEEKVMVAGIRNYYKPEDLVNKKVVVINNLQGAVIRGVESKGMILAAKDARTLAILVPERDVETGSAIS